MSALPLLVCRQEGSSSSFNHLPFSHPGIASSASMTFFSPPMRKISKIFLPPWHTGKEQSFDGKKAIFSPHREKKKKNKFVC